ncbi:MAG: hypothetical protein ACO1TE_03345 [Prosthecobacter sp.]
MKLRIAVLAGLTLLTAFTSYASGRGYFELIVPPVLIPAFLTLLAAVWVLLPCRTGGPWWKRWMIRVAALAGCLFFLGLPAYVEPGIGYFEMGRRDHIRSLFTPELIAELRASVSKLSARRDKQGSVDLSAADLPPAVARTPWGAPGHAYCSFDEQDRLASVVLTWGGALIAHHGLVISDEQIPPRGYGYHGPGDQGEDIVVYTEHYYPLYPGSYVFIDDN